ncbi:hypothetical protein [Veillonella magna]|uniref:hypothetical protein n=1 Tax=Veillonella magna TaxID=464322 RepID=UPI0026DBA69D|nr:hypothetical protein [Veillonella magna]
MDARAYVKDTLLLLNELHAEGIIEKMTNRFANTYTQKSDRHILSYDMFISHLQALRSAMSRLMVTVLGAAAYEETVLTHHHVKVWKKSEATPSEVEVYAHFAVGEDGIQSCEEVSRVIRGSVEDADLSHRQ